MHAVKKYYIFSILHIIKEVLVSSVKGDPNVPVDS